MKTCLLTSDLYILMKRMVSLMQIVNWRTHLKFPEEAKLSNQAKDLICKLLCNVEQRLGTKGAPELKVGIFTSHFRFLVLWVFYFLKHNWYVCNYIRHTHGLKDHNGIDYIRWKQLSYLRSRMS